MAMHMSRLLRALAVNTQCGTTTTDLRPIALASHRTLRLRDRRAAHQLVPTETLSTILCTRQAVAARVAVVDAFRVGDGVLADVGECDAA